MRSSLINTVVVLSITTVPVYAQKQSPQDSVKFKKTVPVQGSGQSTIAVPTNGTGNKSNGDLVSQINSQYNNMEQNIELQFAKLSTENRNRDMQLRGVNERLYRQNDSLARRIQQPQTGGVVKTGSKPDAASSKNYVNQLNQQITLNNQQIKNNQSQIDQLNIQNNKLKADKQKSLDDAEKQRKIALDKASKKP